MPTCRTCDQEIRFIPTTGNYGHERNPGPKHHPAYPRRVMSATFAERFWQRVEKTESCWWWTGDRDGRGYGLIRTSDTGFKAAHRYAYATLVGDIPEGLVIDHLCRNPRCVNPDHLEPVTNTENVLRGVGFAAVNARKEFCLKGHPLAEPNLVALKRGGRTCKTCHRDRMRARGSLRADYMRQWKARQRAKREAENEANGAHP